MTRHISSSTSPIFPSTREALFRQILIWWSIYLSSLNFLSPQTTSSSRGTPPPIFLCTYFSGRSGLRKEGVGCGVLCLFFLACQYVNERKEEEVRQKKRGIWVLEGKESDNESNKGQRRSGRVYQSERGMGKRKAAGASETSELSLPSSKAQKA